MTDRTSALVNTARVVRIAATVPEFCMHKCPTACYDETTCLIRPHDFCSAGTCNVCMDAARYEFLRENWRRVITHQSCSPSGMRIVDCMELAPETLGQPLDPQSLDHAIDAAIRADNERAFAVKTPETLPTVVPDEILDKAHLP